jgi:hypothetical protein
MANLSQRKSNFIYDNIELIEAFNKSQVSRKKALYWLGFLEGAMSSGKIEKNEPVAIINEAKAFADFFGDPDAIDFIEDFNARCFSSPDDIFQCISDMADEKFNQLLSLEHASETDELNRFLGFCAGIICDGEVLEKEALAIRKRFVSNPILYNEPSLQDIRDATLRALSDGVLDANESAEIGEFIGRLVGDGYAETGIANIGQVSCIDGLILDPNQVTLFGKTFVITGPMRLGTRSYVVRLIEQAGGFFSSAPSKKVDYIVVAVSASTMWKTTHYGTKIERARKLISSGAQISFLCESALEGALRNRAHAIEDG